RVGLGSVGGAGGRGGGEIVLAAPLETRGRGLNHADPAGVHAVVLKGDTDPGEAGATFSGFGPNPQVNDAGAVAFSGTTELRSPLAGVVERHSGIFVMDPSRIPTLALDPDPSPPPP